MKRLILILCAAASLQAQTTYYFDGPQPHAAILDTLSKGSGTLSLSGFDLDFPQVYTASRREITLLPTYCWLREEFGTGGTTSGTIGQLGWLTSGSPTIISGYEGGSGIGLGATTVRAPAPTSALTAGTIYLGSTDSAYAGGFIRRASLESYFMFRIPSGSLGAYAFSVGYGLRDNLNVPSLITPKYGAGCRYVPAAGGAWAGSTAYAQGVARTPTTPNGFKYVCTTAGTTSASEPTWPTTLGATVSDGSAVWSCAGANGAATFVFFVTGSDPLATSTTAASSVTVAAATTYTLSMRVDASNVYFSINGETEVSIALTNLGSELRWAPFFAVRSDTFVTADFNAFFYSVLGIR